MFECTLEQGALLKSIISAIADLVSDGNFQCDANHINFQGMDSSHVSLVALSLRKEGFAEYRCDRDVTLGINFSSLAKMLKCMGSQDKLSIRADDDGDSALFIFENPKEDRISNFDLKLMDIDQEQLGIPDTEYKCVVRMPSSEFQKICRDLGAIGDTVVISATKEGIKFSVTGDIGSGDMTLRSNTDDGCADEDADDRVLIALEEPVTQTFALRYLNSFAKGASLSKTVTLSLSPEVPLVVEYAIDDLGDLKYYLAPKIDDDE
jgi:proliferating cell nuclear antigen